MRFFWMGFFGLVGIFSRFGVDTLVLKAGAPAPWGTLTINSLGSFIAGVFFAIGAEKGLISPDLLTPLMVGLLGGFTTFSAFSLQSALLLQEKTPWLGLLYLSLTPLLGALLSFAGLFVGRRI
ncbi:CrcB family protein [Bdellovibrionota bacterium FG-1]